MSNIGLISVIVPTFNCEKYIREAIDSIIKQTVQAYEILVIDDGSTDNTKLVVESFLDSNIKYHFQKNSGVSSARNAGIKIAKGKYVAFLDADDRWLPTMLEEQVRVLESYPGVVFSVTNFIRFEDSTAERLPEQFSFYSELDGLSFLSSVHKSVRVLEKDAFSALVSFGEFPAFTSAIMFRRAALHDIGFNTKLKICEDVEFVLRVATRGRVAFNANVLMEMRRHGSNATNDWKGISKNKLDALLIVREYPDLTDWQIKSIENRLVKAYVDACIGLVRKRDLVDALKLYLNIFTIKNNYRKKTKGAARLILEFVRVIFKFRK